MFSLAGHIEIVSEATTHEEAVAVISELKPEVVLDLEMASRAMGADESMGRMLGLSPPPRVVVFTMPTRDMAPLRHRVHLLHDSPKFAA